MVLRNITRRPLRAAASIFGIGFAVAILMIGFVFNDAIERLIETQFWVAERQDVTINFVEPRSGNARLALARLPGVVAVEPQRAVAVRGVRSIMKQDMVHNGYRPKIEVDPQTYEVRADGVHLTCEPATVLPLAQRYFLF